MAAIAFLGMFDGWLVPKLSEIKSQNAANMFLNMLMTIIDYIFMPQHYLEYVLLFFLILQLE